MSNKFINDLSTAIKKIERSHKGNYKKAEVEALITKRMNLSKQGSLYSRNDGAIRFSYSKTGAFSNTVLGFSKIVKNDTNPLIVVLVRPEQIDAMLINTSFIRKVSHSSKLLSASNHKGSINGGDILSEINGSPNHLESLNSLFQWHLKQDLGTNIKEIIRSTTQIKGTGKAVVVNEATVRNMKSWPDRYKKLMRDSDYIEYRKTLKMRVLSKKNEILRAAEIENSNLRAKAIEDLITKSDADHDFSDYVIFLRKRVLLIDLKTKLVDKSSAPKAFSIDKLVDLAGDENTYIFMCIILIDRKKKKIESELVPIVNQHLVDSFTQCDSWSGRNSLGHLQIDGEALATALSDPNVVENKTWHRLVSKLMPL